MFSYLSWQWDRTNKLVTIILIQLSIYSTIARLWRATYEKKANSTSQILVQSKYLTGLFAAGIVGGVGAHFANASEASRGFGQITPWAIPLGYLIDTHTLRVPRLRFRAAIKGAISTVLLVLRHTPPLQDIPHESTSYKLCIMQPAVGLALLGVFLFIPRRRDIFVKGRPVDRQYTGSMFEFVTFSWAKKLFDAEKIHHLTIKDLPTLLPTSQAKHLSQYYKIKSHLKGGLILSLAKMYTIPLLLQWGLAIFKSIVILAPAWIMYKLLQWLSCDTQRAADEGMALAALLGLSKITEVLVDAWIKWVTSSMIQLPMQATMSALVYKKSLHLPAGVDGAENGLQTPTLAHMQMHTARATALYTDSHRIAMTVAKLITTTTFLISIIGWQSLGVGIAASAFVMPLNVVLSKKYGGSQTELTKLHEQRSSVLASVLLAIRQIKISAVENQWKSRISNLREKELRQLFIGALWMTALVFAANIGPIILAGVPIYIFAWRGGQPTASVAFTSISLFQQLHSDISILPLTTPPIWQAWQSLRRIEMFLATKELDTTQSMPSTCTSLTSASITWHGAGDNRSCFTLRDVSLTFPSQQLSVVTGQTGSGKTLLLTAIAGEAKLLRGSVHSPRCSSKEDKKDAGSWIRHDRMALVSQSPWIENTTIRENIVFGMDFDNERYQTTLYCCALREDLKTLKNGDETMIGINGVTLSGGQRWRVALARALYSKAGLILLDDILSALDAEVRKWIVDMALFGDLAKGRTRVIATHHASLCLPKASYHVTVGDGTAEAHTLSLALPSSPTPVPEKEVTDEIHIKNDKSVAVVDTSLSQSQSPFVSHPSAYRTYFTATGGWSSFLLVLLATSIYESVAVATAMWLKEWTSQRQRKSASDSYFLSYETSYLLISAVSCLVTAARCAVWFSLGIMASRKLFAELVAAIFGAHLPWLEETSHGEILTRFNQDMNAVDKRLPHDVGYLIECLTRLIATMFTSMTFAFYEIPVMASILYLYYTNGMSLFASARKLKAIRLTASASVQQHLSSLQVADSIVTIRAYGMTGRFIERMHQLIDDSSSSAWHSTLCSVMMEVRLGILGSLFITASSFFMVVTSADAGTAGVALSFAMKFAATMTGLLQRIATVESGLQSVERITDYSNVRQECTAGVDVPPSWPSEGQVQVRNLCASYRANLPYVLRNISFTINPGERLGVVGRTGAGKSSLALAFARLIELREGHITIDNINITTVKLDVLRRRLFIIPQDPYLFAGSLRTVLDPDGQHGDDALLAVLRRVWPTGRDAGQQDISMDLSFAIQDGGRNLSQGQRQILYLARALTAKNKIIIMDEATSAVDVETDATVQTAIRSGLAGATVVVIAHRLATVVDFDKVLVLYEGTVAEFGSPQDIYRRKGVFWKLVHHSIDSKSLIARIYSTHL